MNNIDRQKDCDKKKWAESEREGKDLSGFMFYCKSCEHANEGCDKTQEEREEGLLCAKAFNKAQKTFYKMRKK